MAIQAELATGVLDLGDVLGKGNRAEQKLAFEGWLADVEALRREAASAWPALRERAGHRDSGIVAATGESAWLELGSRALQLVTALELDEGIASRLVRSAGAARPWSFALDDGELGDDPETPGIDRLPSVLRRRAIWVGDEIENIRARFVSANQGLVTYVVQRYAGMGLAPADLMQEGNIGLMRAIDKFDPRRGSRFGTYAIWWIRQGVRRALANQSRMIRVPVHALGTRYTVERAARRLSVQRGHQPSEQELSEETGLAPSSVAQVMNLVKEPLSLDAPRGTDTDIPLGDSLTDANATSAVEEAASKQRHERLRCLLASLSPREQQMVKMRFGLDGADECTLDQIGREFDLTRERVRQIVTAALQKLQRQDQRRELSFAD